MITKRQKIKIVILIIILVVAIVAGVFAVSYSMGGYQVPWKTTQEESSEKQAKPKQKKDKQETLEKKHEEGNAKELAEIEEEPESEVSTLNKNYNYYGALKVEGTKLCDSKNNPVQLVGISSHGINSFPEYITADSISYMKKAWGINVIRLAMYTSDYNGYCVGDDNNRNALKEKIDEGVKAAIDNDMYVIIDWHILNDNNPNEYKSEAIQFFGEMVRKYENNENVLYEICNEPNGDTTWDDIYDYASEVIPVIRNVNEDAVILVGTPSWCQDVDQVIDKPLEYDNIMYDLHFYGSTHKSKLRNRLMDAIDDGTPIFISECGFSEADGNGKLDVTEAEKWLDVIEEYQLSYCVWNLSNKNETSALISNGCDKTTDWTYEDLSEQGKFIHDYWGSIATKEEIQGDEE